MQSSFARKRFKPGDLTPITGIYLVRHELQHRGAHEAVIIRGEQFPACRTCGVNVSYENLRPISHIIHDWDFFGLTPGPRPQDYANVRIFPRCGVHLPISARLTHTSKPVLVQGSTCDLSEGGVGAMMEDKLGSAHSIVLLNIGLGPNQESISLRARLRYRAGLRHGFEFTRTNALERATIRQFCVQQRKGQSAATSMSPTT